MTRQVVNIGVEGNDGTGDSIREAFKKSNENFQELYAVFGQGGQIGFSSLSDTPNTLTDSNGNGNLVPITAADGSAVELRKLVGQGVTIDYTSNPDEIKIVNLGAAVENDLTPSLGGDLDGLNLFAIGRIVVSDAAATRFNNSHNLVGTANAITIDDLVTDKKYNDKNYAPNGVKTGKPIPARDEPADATEYTLTITAVNGVDCTIANHGLTKGNDGDPYVFAGTSANDLVDGTTYYIKKKDNNVITLHPTEASALAGNAALQGATGTITNGNYNTDLSGFYLETEALPRKHAVKRSGDTMTGDLFLNDHPGTFKGIDTGNKEDFQAATKYYVDNTSFASVTNIYVSTQGDDVQANRAFDKKGRSPAAAFRSINKAAELAEELMATARVEPGPYLQTVTYGNTPSTAGTPAPITAKGFTNGSGYTTLIQLMTDNRQFIVEDTIAYVNTTFPNFSYDEATCARDVGLIIDSIKLDLAAGATTNFLTIQAGLRYFSNVSGRKAISTQLTETIAAIQHAKNITNTILQNQTVTAQPSNPETQVMAAQAANVTARTAAIARFDKIVEIIDGDQQGNDPGLASTGPVVEGSTYSFVVDNGGFGNLDQSDPTNIDMRPGKVIRGQSSGALGRIVEVTNAASEDTVKVQLLEPIEYEIGETLEYGNFIKKAQISIRVESGIYEEHYPIKIPQNVSIKGDEFRRVIIRPAEGMSQSKWANLYFYRDATFDGLTIASQGTVDPITGGYYGRHYLLDPTSDINISTFGKKNPGAFEDASALIRKNKEFIVEEVIAYINDTYPTLVYNTTKCRRDTGYIVDGIVKDLLDGGRKNSLRNQGAYYAGAVSGQETETEDAIQHISTLAANILANDSANPYTALQTVESQIFDSNLTAETASQTWLDALVDCVAFAFDTDYKPAKDNNQLDVFLMNDASILRNVSCQEHGGFMNVLDPEGQVLTKSPYIQTASSFSQGINDQAFRGGMFIDAWVGNIPMVVYSDPSSTPFRLYVASVGGTGLFTRKPQTPAPFYIDGIRYTVNAVESYDQAAGTAVLLLDPTSGEGNGFTETIPAFSDPDPQDPTQRTGGYELYVQTAGNRSMLSNDNTQVNDDGYGTIATNGGLSELVSQFTYYCHTAYFANNGGQIRSLNGSNAYGEYGLVAAGADPNEIPDDVGLISNFVQSAKIYDDGGTYDHPLDQLYCYVTGCLQTPQARGEIEINHGGLIGLTRYEITTVQDITATDPLVVGTVAAGRLNKVYKVNFSTSGQSGRSDTGLKAVLANDQAVTLRCNQNFLFDGLRETQPIRPSTALKFTELSPIVYRTISFETVDATGANLPNNDESTLTIDQTYDYIRLAVKQSEIVNANADGDPGTMGAATGDTMLAIETLSSQDDIDRLNNNTITDAAAQPTLQAGEVRQAPHIFGWEGQTYEVYEYVQRTGFATVKIRRYADQATTQTGATGLGASLQFANFDVTLRAGLQGKVDSALTTEVTPAKITFKISTCRATGHDFLDIGTGSYNDSNYPNVVLGEPIVQSNQDREVDERTEGRCFYVSTDQDGFFRVGRFFTVDQGTGRVTFSAQIALSNLDGIGFKRGVAITAFLTDTSMADNATDAVPTQSAVVGYVNRRLGFTADGTAVSNPLSTFIGYLKLNGGQMTGPINMTANHIINIPDIQPDYNDDSVAVNKAYVDANLEANNELTELRNMEIVNPTAGDLLVASGYYRIIVDNTVDGDWENHIGETLTTSSGSTGTLIDAVDTLIRGDARTILTYDLTSATQFPNTDTVSYSGGVNAQIISPGGIPVDEYVSCHPDTTNGDISVSVTRNGPAAPGPDSYVSLNIGNGKISNVHIAANAAIDQSKLNMNIATARNVAPSGTAAQIQAASGLASFDDSQFDVTAGWASIQDAGITKAKIENIASGVALGRLSANSGAVEEVTFADIVSNGIDSTTTGQANKIVKTTATGAIVAGAEINAQEVQINSVKLADAPTGTTSHVLYSPAGTAALTLDGSTVTVGGNIETTNVNANIGASNSKFNTVYATTFDGTATTARYADLAENYLADDDYEVGTVVAFGGEYEVTVTQTKGDHRVAGVVSTNPAHLMNSELEGDNVKPIALQGRVPCKVIGKVEKGDMLVTSAIAGYAMVNNTPGIGQVIGKAVGIKTDDGKGIVEVVVGRV